ncbi:hypothetical protein KI387_002330, partial [Taxus chinensis]
GFQELQPPSWDPDLRVKSSPKAIEEKNFDSAYHSQPAPSTIRKPHVPSYAEKPNAPGQVSVE